MSAFSRQKAAGGAVAAGGDGDPAAEPQRPTKRAPTGTFTIPLSAYADTWKLRPTAPHVVGLRQLAERDYENGAKRAMEEAWVAFPVPSDADRREEHFVNTLMRWVVARGTCLADDVTKPAFSSHDEYVAGAFTPDGIKLLYQAVEDHKIEESCLGAEVDAVGFAALARLASSAITVDRLLARLTHREKRRLAHVLAEMKRETGDLMAFADDEKYPVIDESEPTDVTH